MLHRHSLHRQPQRAPADDQPNPPASAALHSASTLRRLFDSRLQIRLGDLGREPSQFRSSDVLSCIAWHCMTRSLWRMRISCLRLIVPHPSENAFPRPCRRRHRPRLVHPSCGRPADRTGGHKMSNQEGHGLKYFFGEDNHFGDVTSLAAARLLGPGACENPLST